MRTVFERINLLAKKYGFNRYLEIGVQRGTTFLNVEMPCKIAVDPIFKFKTNDYKTDMVSFFKTTSDQFFLDFPKWKKEKIHNFNDENFKFDIVYIDGLHTFEQSYKDFQNAIKFVHDKSIIILDDTVPCDPYSAITNQEKALFYRKMCGLPGRPWHGDVYKTVFAIHDIYPEYSYATQISDGNPQTIIWKSEKVSSRIPILGKSIERINALSYFDMCDNAHILVPVDDNKMLSLIGQNIDPRNFCDKIDMSLLIHDIMHPQL